MPNWCYSEVTITAPKESIDLIYSEMEKALSSDPYDTFFGNVWLGNLLGHIGLLDEKGRTKDKEFRYRGSVEWYERPDDTTITMDTESAWGPAISCIKAFVDHYADDATIYYTAEEPGLGLYWTNNPDELDSVHLAGYDLDDVPDELLPFECEDYYSRDYLISKLQEILDTKETDLNILASKWETLLKKYNEEASIYINKLEFVEIGEDT